ncbi:unnamed protein product [Brachionus calyciflorus]|uniref:C-type lectin domain-containing protein n=1 Tax=Brachionus calyciflorus TaxID=104777 RepID=A0A814BZD1_9BILA|nr:unnamed protein product [Brachionus calyciflorus]
MFFKISICFLITVLVFKVNAFVPNSLLDSKRLSVCKQPNSYGFNQRAATNKHYLVSDQSFDWMNAELFCLNLGAHLPIPTNAEDTKFYRNFFTTSVKTFKFRNQDSSLEVTGYWLGGYRSQANETWFWVDGSKFTYTEWLENEPNNLGKIENVAHDWFKVAEKKWLGWNDCPLWASNYYTICELKC